MAELIKLEKGVSLIKHDDGDNYTIEYNNQVLMTIVSEFGEDTDAITAFNAVILGIRLVETHGLEVFKAVEKVVADG